MNGEGRKSRNTRSHMAAGITICLINQKGGCGKSSSCFHLSGHFAKAGKRVLLVDADPQGSLSQGFFGSELIETLEPSETLAAMFDDERFFSCPEALPVQTPFPGISIVRANQTLAPYNTPCPETTGMKQYALRGFLDELDGYDVVLIDCPPNLYQCSWNAMVAADFVVIPVPPEDFGTQGLRVVHQAVEQARQLNPRLELLGHIVTRYDNRLLVHRSYEKKLRQLYGDSVLNTVVPEASAFKVALACRQPVTHYSAKSKASQLTRQLGHEIESRMQTVIAKRNVA